MQIPDSIKIKTWMPLLCAAVGGRDTAAMMGEYFGELKCAREIAQIHGCNFRTVRNRINYGLRKLRECGIEPEGWQLRRPGRPKKRSRIPELAGV